MVIMRTTSRAENWQSRWRSIRSSPRTRRRLRYPVRVTQWTATRTHRSDPARGAVRNQAAVTGCTVMARRAVARCVSVRRRQGIAVLDTPGAGRWFGCSTGQHPSENGSVGRPQGRKRHLSPVHAPIVLRCLLDHHVNCRFVASRLHPGFEDVGRAGNQLLASPLV